MSSVTEHLEEQGVHFEVLPASTGPDDPSGPVSFGPDHVETVVLDVRTGHAFAVLPAHHRIDLDKVRSAISSRHVELATDDEIARDYPEFEIDAIPPLGALVRTPVIVDESLLEHDEVVFAAGSRAEAVRMRTRDLFATSNIRVADISAE